MKMPVNERPNSRRPGARLRYNGTRGRVPATDRVSREGAFVKVRIDAGLCQGHGRCYDLAPDLFGDDDEGYGRVLGDGVVPSHSEDDARRAALNCPEQAIRLPEGE